jgi:putative lumazine-binding protein
MKRFSLAGLGLALVFALPSFAQNDKASDSFAVRTTVRNYIEAYYTGDAQRMEQTLHPHFLKHVIRAERTLRDMSGLEMVKGVASGPADIPQTQRTERVTVLDIEGDMASAKLVTPGWVDYMTLAKMDGQWKILSVVQRVDE